MDRYSKFMVWTVVVGMVGLIAIGVVGFVIPSGDRADKVVGVVADRGVSSNTVYVPIKSGNATVYTQSRRTVWWIVVEQRDGSRVKLSLDARLWEYVRIGDGWPTLDAGK